MLGLKLICAVKGTMVTIQEVTRVLGGGGGGGGVD